MDEENSEEEPGLAKAEAVAGKRLVFQNPEMVKEEIVEKSGEYASLVERYVGEAFFESAGDEQAGKLAR